MISIVMTYFNRKTQLEHTLKTITASEYKDIEVIIVDDFSSVEHDITELCKSYPFVKLIKLQDTIKEKWYSNPCIPYNIGFSECKGDKIIIQNSECCHIGDVISYVNSSLTDNNYITFCCYSLCEASTKQFQLTGNIKAINAPVYSDGTDGWYNHSTFRPVGYHFTSAISRSNMKKINGFDERFARGHGYDDNEFLERIKRAGLNVQFIGTPFVVHQYHYGVNSHKNIQQDNCALYNNTVRRESKITANEEKQLLKD